MSEHAEFLVNSAIKALIYDDGTKKRHTHHSLKIANKAMSTGHPDTLLIKGILNLHHPETALKYINEAEAKGSVHSLTYFYQAFLGSQPSPPSTHLRPSDELKALELRQIRDDKYIKAIGGGCELGYCGLYTREGGALRDIDKCVRGLLDVEATGVASGDLVLLLGEYDPHQRYFSFGASQRNEQDLPRNYFVEAMWMGYAKAFRRYYDSAYGDDRNEAILTALKLKKRGKLDDRVLLFVIGMCLSNMCAASQKVLAKTKAKDMREVALYLCDILISMKSPYGYALQQRVYVTNLGNPQPQSPMKFLYEYAHQQRMNATNLDDLQPQIHMAMQSLNEGLKQGLLHSDALLLLADFYLNSKSGFKKSGSDVVKVCDMVIELAEDATIKLKAYNILNEMYTNGCPPIYPDKEKKKEIRAKIITLNTHLSFSSAPWESVPDWKRYYMGISVIPRIPLEWESQRHR